MLELGGDHRPHGAGTGGCSRQVQPLVHQSHRRSRHWQGSDKQPADPAQQRVFVLAGDCIVLGCAERELLNARSVHTLRFGVAG
jgi:hypothetical protein